MAYNKQSIQRLKHMKTKSCHIDIFKCILQHRIAGWPNRTGTKSVRGVRGVPSRRATQSLSKSLGGHRARRSLSKRRGGHRATQSLNRALGGNATQSPNVCCGFILSQDEC